MQQDGVMTLTASGHRCPKTGRYQSLNNPREFVDLKEGQAVPVLDGKVSYWKLTAAEQK